MDAATPEARRDLAFRLLVAAIRHYERALVAVRRIDSTFRLLDEPAHDYDDESMANRREWLKLMAQYDEEFETAERALASRIRYLYDDLAPEGKRIGEGPSLYFVERAVKYRGTTYAVQYPVDDYEPGTCIIAIVRDGCVFELSDGVSQPCMR